MAMAVISNVVCDRHLHADEVHVEADFTNTVIAVGKKTIEGDWCKGCVEEAIEALQSFFDAGRRPTKAERPDKTPRASPGTVNGNIRSDDPKPGDPVVLSSAERARRQGKDAPLPGPYQCRWRGGFCDRQEMGFTTGMGRGAHERSAHVLNFSKLSEKEQKAMLALPAPTSQLVES